ncbi:MAG: riboflavin synthase [Ferruginibacter sp.]
MFTGIIEQTGIIRTIEMDGTNLVFWVESFISNELKPDQSVSHNGVCLTIEKVSGTLHRVTAISETLQKTTLKNWKTGTTVNLERCMQLNGRLDGHIVQGHVDGIAICTSKIEVQGSWEFIFEVDHKFAGLVIEKGSITLNGISLTIYHVTPNSFSVAIIPYTFLHTSMQYIQTGEEVNIEFDMIGKYVNRYMQINNGTTDTSQSK